MPGKRYYGKERELLAGRVYRMRAKRATFVEIADELSVGKDLAATLYREALDARAVDEEFSGARKESIATYETIIRGVYDRGRTSQPQTAHSPGPIGVCDRG
jgi:hypothetical protein